MNTRSQRTLSIAALCPVLAIGLLTQAYAQVYGPGGRLTLVSNTPVMTTDVSGATTVYYTAYTGNNAPAFGLAAGNYGFASELTLNLDSSLLAGSIHDIFLLLNGLTYSLCTGPAWSSSSSRGTAGSEITRLAKTVGAGSTQLTLFNGLWVNADAISGCLNGSSSVSVPASAGLYLGSVYMTGNGQTSVVMQPAGASGGSNNIIGLFNAYNRVKAYARSIDTRSGGWIYSSTTVREADGSSSNRISFLDGLGVIPIYAQYTAGVYPASNNGLIGVGINSTTTFSQPPAYYGASGPSQSSPTGIGMSYPIVGLNYVQALEANNSNATISYGVSENPTLYATLEY